MSANVLVDLQAAGTGLEHPLQRLRSTRRSAREHQCVDRRLVERGMNVLESPNRIGTEVPDRAIVLDHERRKTGSQRLRNDLRRQQVHVRVDGSRGCDQALTGDDCRICPKHDVDAIHDVRVTSPPD